MARMGCGGDRGRAVCRAGSTGLAVGIENSNTILNNPPGMAGIVALAAIAATGVIAYQNSIPSIIKESIDKEISYVFPTGYEELSNQVVDPGNIISNPMNTPIFRTESGPFGIPRNLHHNRGDYTVVSWGYCPGLHCNI